MIAAAINRTLSAMLAFAAARPGLRRHARTLVRTFPPLARSLSAFAAVAQADMIAAAASGERTGIYEKGRSMPGFADRERLLANARRIVANDRALAGAAPCDGGWTD